MLVNPSVVFLLFALIFSASAAELQHPFKQCSSRSFGEVLNVSVNAACDAEYCTFYKNTTAELKIVFKLNKRVPKIRAKVMATVGSIDHKFIIPNHNGCDHLPCPLKSGITYTYQNHMFVRPIYPSVKVNQMRYYLIDGRGRELVCVSLPVMITEKDSKQ